MKGFIYMGTTVTVDGNTFVVPSTGERSWSPAVDNLLIALADASLLIKGGAIPLTSEADFGATAGLMAVWFASRTANSASTGIVRLANLDAVNWRNTANNGDLTLTVTASDELTFNGNKLVDEADLNNIAGAGLSESGAVLSVNVDDVGIEISADALQLKASGVTTTKIANDAVDKDKVAADVAGAGLGQNVDGSLEVNVDDSTIEISTDTIQVKDSGITGAKLEDDIVLPGTGAVTVPDGLTGERPTPTNGMIRYNTTSNKFEAYENGAWVNVIGAGTPTADPDTQGTVTSFTPIIKSSVNSVSGADYTITDTDGYDKILVTTGASTRTITLPTAADNTGRVITIMKVDSGAGEVTVDGEGAELIGSSTTLTLSEQYQRAQIVCNGTSWDLLYASPNGLLKLNTGNGHGSTDTAIRRFSTTEIDVGDAFTYADSATTGMSVTINRDCVASITYNDRYSASTTIAGVSLNSGSGSTPISSLVAGQRIAIDYSTTDDFNCATITRRFKKNDVVRAHTNGNPNNTTAVVAFTIQEVERIGN